MVDEYSNEITERFDEIAVVLNLSRETLPSGLEIERSKPLSALEKAVEGVELSDAEWHAIAPVFPKGVAHHARDDRGFLNACLWRERAKPFKKGWWFVPLIYGPTSSNRGRFLRWCKLGFWPKLHQALIESCALSDARLNEFFSIAEEAETRRMHGKSSAG